MTREELFLEIKKRNIKFTHILFDDHEYLERRSDGCIYDENGYLFEDFGCDNCWNGMRIRQGGAWEKGWSIIQ